MCTVLLLIAQAAMPEAQAAMSSALLGKGPENPSAFGWGLHLEAPVAGVLANAPPHNQASWGSQLGLGLAVEVWPRVEARLQISRGRADAGTLSISYASGNSRPEDVEVAQWRATLVALGLAYVWRSPGRFWEPYVGADAVGGYGGYALTYTDEVAKNLEAPPTAARSSVPTPHLADAALWGGGARGGLRLRLSAWLSTQMEVGGVFLPMGAVGIDNNRPVRDVRTVPHTAILLYGVFSVRVSL